jgi:hypothetical protein
VGNIIWRASRSGGLSSDWRQSIILKNQMISKDVAVEIVSNRDNTQNKFMGGSDCVQFSWFIHGISPFFESVGLGWAWPLGTKQNVQSLSVGGRVIQSDAVEFHPSMAKEWRGAIADYQASIHLAPPKQPNGDDGTLQALDRPEIETRRCVHGAANVLNSCRAGRYRDHRSVVEGIYQAMKPSEELKEVVANQFEQRANDE